MFFHDGQGTKYALAELLAKSFPEELGHRLPPKCKPWESEKNRMDIDYRLLPLKRALNLVITDVMRSYL